MTRLFTYQPHGNIEKHKIITVNDAAEVDELLQSNKAIILEMPELDRLSQEADRLHDTYKADVERIKSSDNPLLQDEKVQGWEIDKLEKAYREKSHAVQAEYEAWRLSEIESAKVRAAQATVKVKDDDRLTAEQFKTRAALKLAVTSDDKMSLALDQIGSEIDLLTDSQKVALQSYIPELLSQVGDAQGKRSLIDRVQDTRNPDALAYTVAAQLQSDILTKMRIEDISKQVVAEGNKTPNGGGISRDFYDKYLKDK